MNNFYPFPSSLSWRAEVLNAFPVEKDKGDGLFLKLVTLLPLGVVFGKLHADKNVGRDGVTTRRIAVSHHDIERNAKDIAFGSLTQSVVFTLQNGYLPAMVVVARLYSVRFIAFCIDQLLLFLVLYLMPRIPVTGRPAITTSMSAHSYSLLLNMSFCV